MPKMKSNRAARKRLRRTRSGLVKRGTVNRRHLLSSMPRKRKRRLRKTAYVSPANIAHVDKLLPGS